MFFARGTPCGVGYGDLFADWELATARRLAHQFMRTKSLRRSFDHEDLVQEVLLHWLDVRDRYTAERGASPQTFMATVATNRLRELTRREDTQSRRVNAIAEPFSTPLSEDPDSGTVGDLAEVVSDTVDATDAHELKAILDRILPTLTPRQQRLISILRDQTNKAEVARSLGISRDTLYEDIARIQKLFLDNGLKDLLR